MFSLLYRCVAVDSLRCVKMCVWLAAHCGSCLMHAPSCCKVACMCGSTAVWASVLAPTWLPHARFACACAFSSLLLLHAVHTQRGVACGVPSADWHQQHGSLTFVGAFRAVCRAQMCLWGCVWGCMLPWCACEVWTVSYGQPVEKPLPHWCVRGRVGHT